MSFSFLEPQLSRQIATANFAEAKLRHPVLAGYDSATEVVRVLRTDHSITASTKAELTSALLGEAQRPDPAFSAALVGAYRPMLGRLVARAAGMVDDESLQESMALEAFLEAVQSWPGVATEPRASLYLLRETKRRFLLDCRRQRRERARMVLVGEAKPEDVPFSWDESGPSREASRFRAEVTELAGELGELLRTAVGQSVARHRLDLIEATLLRGEELDAYVERTFPEQSPTELRRTYNRLQQDRYRTLQRLRRRLEAWRADILSEVPPPPSISPPAHVPSSSPNSSASDEVSP